jgi:hypothetical protein
MASSFAISILFQILNKSGCAPATQYQLLITVFCTTVCWLVTAYLGPRTDPLVLAVFYRKIHPFGPGWRRVRIQAGISEAEAAMYARSDNFPMALLGWFAGCTMIWSALFTVGNFLYGRTNYALALLAVFVVSATIVIEVVRRLWR